MINEDKHLRKKVLYLDPRVVLNAIRSIAHGVPCPQIRGLPEDVTFHDIYFDHQRCCFSILLCSFEWPIHEEGKYLEQVDGEIIYPPTHIDQAVLWQELKHKLCAKEKALKAKEAVELVVSGAWKDGSNRLEDISA